MGGLQYHWTLILYNLWIDNRHSDINSRNNRIGVTPFDNLQNLQRSRGYSLISCFCCCCCWWCYCCCCCFCYCFLDLKMIPLVKPINLYSSEIFHVKHRYWHIDTPCNNLVMSIKQRVHWHGSLCHILWLIQLFLVEWMKVDRCVK